jgi:type IV fimbrial biogenesis protein FimT
MKRQGFTLIELMMVVAIVSIMTVMAMPAFGLWLSNVRVRTMAESIQNGLRQAKNEAALRNDAVVLKFTNTDPPTCTSTAEATGRNWVVCWGTTQIQMGYGDAGAKGANVSSDFSSVTFNGLGRTTLASSGVIDITSSGGTCEASGGNVRCLRILVSAGGKLRMCDPKRAADDPAGCGV